MSFVTILLIIPKPCYSQQKSPGRGAPIVLLRDGITSNDGDIPTATVDDNGFYEDVEDDLGTPFNSWDYSKVRIYVKMSDNNTTCRLRPIIWNNTIAKNDIDTPNKSGWSVDSPNVKTSVGNGYTFLWESRHASSIQMLIDSIVGSGTIDVYIQGSNE